MKPEPCVALLSENDLVFNMVFTGDSSFGRDFNDSVTLREPGKWR
jgi:hypothetical protein